MLKLHGLSKTYKTRGGVVTALSCTTLDIPRGDFVSIVGPSGSGKSTLLLILGGMLSPCSGKVFLDGQSVYDMSPDQRANLRRTKIGFVFQTFNLVSYLTAVENVQVPMLLTGLGEVEQNEKAIALLERMGLGNRLDHKPAELSVGQQQRVALARTLANDPELVLADEPTGNLDPDTTAEIMAFFDEINSEGRTVVVVTHDPEAAQRARQVLRLVEGRVNAIEQDSSGQDSNGQDSNGPR